MLEYINTNHPYYTYFEKLGLPKNKTEQYRNFPIEAILETQYTFDDKEFKLPYEGTRLVIENGEVREYPKGTHVTFKKLFELDTNHFDALYFMSHIIGQRVIYIEVLENISFEVLHLINKSETLLSYRIVVKTLENQEVNVFENFEMQGSENSFLLYGIDAEVLQDSSLVWIRNENRQVDEASVVGTHRYNVSKLAALELKTFDFGSANSLHLSKVDLANYAWIDASHLLLASNKARRGNVIEIHHNEAYAKSAQEARSILRDKATGIFDAKITISSNAKYSNAAQNSKAILLDENAHMYAKPQLEIYTDELEASHGATIGELDEDALFYLCSRGISLEDARKMLVLAFANILIDTVKDKKYAQQIRDEFDKAYYTKDIS